MLLSRLALTHSPFVGYNVFNFYEDAVDMKLYPMSMTELKLYFMLVLEYNVYIMDKILMRKRN